MALLLLASTRRALAAPFLWTHDDRQHLGRIDVATGAAVIVGRTERTLWDIAFAPDGSLYGITGGATLYLIDPASAASTRVPYTSDRIVTGANGAVFRRDGVLFFTGRLSANGHMDCLFRIDVSARRATFVGKLTPYASAGDLAFDDRGRMLMSTTGGELVQVDPQTGRTTLIGEMGFRGVLGLAFGPDHALYGLTSDQQILSIDSTTGTGTVLRSYRGIGGALGSSFREEARPPSTSTTTTVRPSTSTSSSSTTTSTSVPSSTTTSSTTTSSTTAPSSTTSTTTLPPSGEVCGNCIDDDQKGLTDLLDPACCSSTAPLRMIRGWLQPSGPGRRLDLDLRAMGEAITSIDATQNDVYLQLTAASHTATYCARMPADRFRNAQRTARFLDRRHSVASAAGIEGVVIGAVPRVDELRIHAQGRGMRLDEIVGNTVYVTVGFSNGSCAAMEARFARVRRGNRFVGR